MLINAQFLLPKLDLVEGCCTDYETWYCTDAVLISLRHGFFLASQTLHSRFPSIVSIGLTVFPKEVVLQHTSIFLFVCIVCISSGLQVLNCFS